MTKQERVDVEKKALNVLYEFEEKDFSREEIKKIVEVITNTTKEDFENFIYSVSFKGLIQ